MGERSLRRLLILGASSAAKVAACEPEKASAWLAGMLARKPSMLVTVAFANKMARIVWAEPAKVPTMRSIVGKQAEGLMAHGCTDRAPAAA